MNWRWQIHSRQDVKSQRKEWKEFIQSQPHESKFKNFNYNFSTNIINNFLTITIIYLLFKLLKLKLYLSSCSSLWPYYSITIFWINNYIKNDEYDRYVNNKSLQLTSYDNYYIVIKINKL